MNLNIYITINPSLNRVQNDVGYERLQPNELSFAAPNIFDILFNNVLVRQLNLLALNDSIKEVKLRLNDNKILYENGVIKHNRPYVDATCNDLGITPSQMNKCLKEINAILADRLEIVLK